MSNSKQSWNIQYRYDPLDQLISRNQSDRPGLHRFYCKDRLTTEIQGAIGHSIVQHGDILLAQQQHQHNTHDSTLLVTDLSRSVLHALKANEQPLLIAYSSYGYHRAESGLSSLLGFNGERPDAVTRHYLLGNGYRAFNPVLMRFNSPDSLSPFGKGGLNSYAYCKGDPINFGDRSGHTLSASMGSFGKISQMPDILENIIQRLTAADMISLASTSKAMKGVVYSSTRKLPTALDEAKKINLHGRIFTVIDNSNKSHVMAPELASTILDIATGNSTGNLPVQFPRNGISISVLGSNIRDATGTYRPALAYDWFVYEPFYSTPKSEWSSDRYRYFNDAILTWTIRSSS